MKTSYFTFGQIHVHHIGGETFDKDCVARITAEDPRQVMFQNFGRQWSHEYDEDPGLEHFPRGIIVFNPPPVTQLNSPANQLVRVLSDQRLKYTCRVHLSDHSVLEWQSQSSPSTKWNDDDRSMWLKTGDYSSDNWIMRWQDGMILFVEENPK